MVAFLRCDMSDPPTHIVRGFRVEERGMRHTDVVFVPRVTFNQQLCDFLHFRKLEKSRSPVARDLPSKIPRDFAQHENMVHSPAPCPRRLLLQPPHQLPPQRVALLVRRVQRPVPPDHVQPAVIRDVKQRSLVLILRSAFVVQHSRVGDELERVLVRVEPPIGGLQNLRIGEIVVGARCDLFAESGILKVVAEAEPGEEGVAALG